MSGEERLKLIMKPIIITTYNKSKPWGGCAGPVWKSSEMAMNGFKN